MSRRQETETRRQAVNLAASLRADGRTLTAIAEVIGCSETTIRRWLKGGYHPQVFGEVHEGETFGRLTALGPGEHSRARVPCLCECGANVTADAFSLRSGNTKSCGCLRRGVTNGRYDHGKADSKIYRIWADMIGRCTRPTHKRYKDYGGRGITVCDRWRSFANFFADMGERPEGRSLDRVDNDGPYAPDNCRWATYQEQRNNRRPQRLRPKCPNGHDYTPENTLMNPRGFRQCVICAEATAARQRELSRQRRIRRVAA